MTSRRLELADGSLARRVRTVRWTPWDPSKPATRRGATALPGSWESVLSARGRGWLRNASIGWDTATEVPSVLVLEPMAAPGSVAQPATAELHARALLGELLPLLAPGSVADDFVLHANDVRQGLRTLVLQQLRSGLPVVGAELSFRFRADRLFLVTSTVIPFASTAPPAVLEPLVDASSRPLLERAATDWLVAEGVANAQIESVGAAVQLPVLSERTLHAVRTVVPVTVTTNAPRGRWAIYVDPYTKAAVARRSLLWHAMSTVTIDAPLRYAAAERSAFPAPFMTVTLGGETATTDEFGQLELPDGPPLELVTSVSGPRVKVTSVAGAAATGTFALDPGSALLWSENDDEQTDAQLSAFVHASVAKAHAAAIAPELQGWLDQQLRIEVNVDDVCNAYYDGYALHFFRAGSGCQNTARLADVVYHEFGHALHHHAMVGAAAAFEEALSEGLSDYFAASITGDPGMGRGFFGDDTPLRDIDPADHEASWPAGVGDDPHETGLILGGALWDLRKALQLELGTAAGTALADELYLAIARGAADIPSSYVEVLAADDDDGDLLNGTPHSCLINAAFGAHGLRTMNVEIDPPTVSAVSGEETAVAIRLSGLVAPCDGEQIDGAWLSWRLRDDPSSEQRVEMHGGPELFTGFIPRAPDHHVVQYRIAVELADGGRVVRPQNPADPYYELYVGSTEPLYCTNFEADPWLEGWTHGLSAGDDQEGADDWQWDTPKGSFANGDPESAFSGEQVLGNDLAHGDFNGLYQPDKTNWAATPTIDVHDFDVVRLQYRRWLGVEDGYYDQATIYGNDVALWTNADSRQGEQSATHHADREWRFHDVDLSAVSTDGTVAVRFELTSDRALELGGWTLDDLCIVGVRRAVEPVVVCGDGLRAGSEQCDDGNTDEGDGCDPRCRLELAGDAIAVEPTYLPAGGCGCAVPNHAPRPHAQWLAVGLALAAGRRRQRRPSAAPRAAR